jgi:tetratricopeptide (TPR) repeat protein
MAIQKDCKEQKIPLKIGIHEGEIVFSKSDVLGDVVNIASRLQESTETGCISISAAVYSEIKNKPDVRTEFIEEKVFKNVDGPIKVYRVACEGEEVTHTSSMDFQRKKKGKKIIYSLIAVIIFILIASMVIWNNPLKKQFFSSKFNSDKSIAVLPFNYLSEDQSKQYLADGILDFITGHLTKIEEMRVTPRTSVEQYRETTKTASTIGKELGVNHLIEGSFFMVNNQVKLTIQLIIVEEEDHALYKEYDMDCNEITDIISVQSEVAQDIAKQVEVLVTPEVKERIESVPTENLMAYNLYLQARHMWIQEGKENLDKSLTYYRKAIELDSNFALAYAGIATTYISYSWFGYAPRKDVIPQAKKAAMKALEIDNTLGEAHTELAWAMLIYDWNWRESEKEFKLAIQLNPNYARAHSLYAWLLTSVGRHGEAIEESNRAVELDPLSIEIWVELGRHYYYARDYNKAIEEYRKILEFFPYNEKSLIAWYPHSELAKALAQKGLYKEAIKEYLKAEFEPTFHWNLGYIYAMAGEQEKAREILNYYLDLSKKEFVWSISIAFIYVGLDDMDMAMEWFEKSYRERGGGFNELKVHPMLDPIRSDPRFQDLLRRVNLSD